MTQPVGWCDMGRPYSVRRRKSNKKNATQESCLHFHLVCSENQTRCQRICSLNSIMLCGMGSTWPSTTPITFKYVPRGQNSGKNWQLLKIFYGVLKYPSKPFPSSRYVARTIRLLQFIKGRQRPFRSLNPLNPELNPICYLLALLGAHHFLHVSRIRVKLLTLRLLMSYIYIHGAPILDVSRSHTTTQHSR